MEIVPDLMFGVFHPLHISPARSPFGPINIELMWLFISKGSAALGRHTQLLAAATDSAASECFAPDFFLFE